MPVIPSVLSLSIVTSIRPTWSCVVLFYSCFNIVFLGFFYGVYELKDSQRAFIGLREFNAVVLFIGGWVMTWANMQVRLPLNLRRPAGAELTDPLARRPSFSPSRRGSPS